MTHYNIDYTDLDPKAADDLAVDDIKAYLNAEFGPTAWGIMLGYAVDISLKLGDASVPGLYVGFSMLGVEGFPVDAFCRKFLLGPYKDWLVRVNPDVRITSNGYVIPSYAD